MANMVRKGCVTLPSDLLEGKVLLSSHTHLFLLPSSTSELLKQTQDASRGHWAMQTDGQEDQYAREMGCVSGFE